VSFAEPMAMQMRASCADAADQAMRDTNQGNDKDKNAFLATVDLGRPIDFGGGIGGVSVMNGSVLKPELHNVEQSPVAPPRPEHQVHDGVRSGTGVGSSSGGSPKMNGQNGAQPAEKAPTPANAEPRASGGGVHPQPRSGTPHAASACAGPPEHQVHDDARSGSSTGSSGGPLKMSRCLR